MSLLIARRRGFAKPIPEPPPPPSGTLLGVGSASTSYAEYPPTGPVTVGDMYVSPSGSDSNSGTSPGSPKATLSAAISAAPSGATILVRDGTYTIPTSLRPKAGQRIFGYGTERPRLVRGPAVSGASNNYHFYVTNNNVHIKGFEITGGIHNPDAYWSSLVARFQGTSGCTWEDIVVHSGQTGAVMVHTSSNFLALDAVTIGCTGAGSGTNVPDGFMVSGTPLSSNVRFVRVLTANTGDDATDFYYAENSHVIDSVAIATNYSPLNGATTGGDGNGFKMGGATGSGPNHVRGSIAVYCRSQGLNNNSTPTSGNTYANNTSTLNNIGIISDTPVGAPPGNTTRNIVVDNNSRNGEVNVGGPTSYNTWNLGISDPLFADPADGDFSLLPGSAAIGAGPNGENLGASTVALELLKKWWNHSLIWIPGRGHGPGGTGLPGDTGTPAPTPTPDPGWNTALWTMDFETGDTADWVTPYPGHEGQDPGSFQNSGNASIAFTNERARRGTYSAALTCDFSQSGEHGARMFRGRFENEYHPEGLYYSAWFYVPQHYITPKGWWNIWQWKTRDADNRSNPTWVLDLLDQGDGSMALRLRDKTSGVTINYPQSPLVAFPVGEWVHIEGFLKPSNTGDGVVTIWQNDQLLYHFADVNTIQATRSEWSVNNYGEGVGGGVVTIFIDDVAISTSRLGSATITPPPAPSSFYWQLQGSVPLDRPEDVYDVDGFNTSAGDVATLKAAGKYVIAYFSGGTYEDWRSDEGDFPPETLGDPLGEWPGERWLITSHLSTLKPIMEARADIAQAKGFHAIEWDNLDGYLYGNIGVSEADHKAYLQMLADITHARGMAAIFKNTSELATWAVSRFDACIAEEPYEWSEVDAYMPWVNAGKALWVIEYDGTLNCTDAQSRGIYLAKYPLALNGPPTATCSLD